MRTTKQVIVMRRKFVIDGDTKTVCTGKMIAQGAHASMAALLNLMSREGADGDHVWKLHIKDQSALDDWLHGRFTKITVYVDTLEELEAVYEKATKAGLIRAMITDAGLTEFKGQPQKTCCAIGPCFADELEGITDKLPLL